MRLVIDGRDVVGQDGATILEAARGAGIAIPALCDHPGLEPFAGCRICLVEIEGRRDFAPACATPAAEGQVVRTRTPEIIALRKKLLEFVLIEHPYACLVCPEKTSCDDLKATIRKTGEVTGCVLCPKNGVCELQKVAGEVGLEKVDLPAGYRNLDIRRDDPFFDRDYNLCILCGRCIRVCEEVRGAAVLSFTHRGGRTEVSTAFGRTLLETGCQFCGACVDVCPTAALLERAVKPRPRSSRAASIVCPFCGQGCVLALGFHGDEVLEARPLHAAPNEGQACVKGRFLVRGALTGPGRILAAHIRRDGRLEPVPLDEGLDRAADGLRAAAAGRTAMVVPSQAPLEDAYLFQIFGRDVLEAGAMSAEPAGTVQGALLGFESRHGLALPVERRLSAIGAAASILAWDVDLPRDHPIAWLEVVRAVRGGAGYVAAGRVPESPFMREAVRLDPRPHPSAGARLAAALVASPGLRERPSGAALALGAGARRIERAYREAAAVLAAQRPAVILFDARAVAGPEGPATLDWLWNIAHLIGARLVPLAASANEVGVNELGLALGTPAGKLGLEALRSGLEAREFEALYLAGPLPDLGGLKPPFLVCQDTHWNPNAERADVVLPVAAFAEAGGTWVNTEGRVRTYAPALPPPGAVPTDGAVLGALAERLGRAAAFAGLDRAAILRKIRGRVPALKDYDPEAAAERPFFIAAKVPGEPRFVPVAAAVSRRGRGPTAKEGIRPDHAGDALRGFDFIARNPGYARLRRAR